LFRIASARRPHALSPYGYPWVVGPSFLSPATGFLLRRAKLDVEVAHTHMRINEHGNLFKTGFIEVSCRYDDLPLLPQKNEHLFDLFAHHYHPHSQE
jgi:hypothetical protein